MAISGCGEDDAPAGRSSRTEVNISSLERAYESRSTMITLREDSMNKPPSACSSFDRLFLLWPRSFGSCFALLCVEMHRNQGPANCATGVLL